MISAISGSVIYINTNTNPDEKRINLQDEINKLEEQISRLTNLLSSDFEKKAPKTIVEKERQKLSDYKESVIKLHKELASKLNQQLKQID